jgi:hypothetical protein
MKHPHSQQYSPRLVFGLLQQTLPGHELSLVATTMGLMVLTLPQAIAAVELTLSDDAAAAVSFWPAIMAAAPIMVTMATGQNVFNSVFLIPPPYN